MTRIATLADIPAVLALWDEARSGTPRPRTRPSPCERLDRSGALIVYEADVVGAMIAAFDGWRGNLYRLAVAATHRRRGHRPRARRSRARSGSRRSARPRSPRSSAAATRRPRLCGARRATATTSRSAVGYVRCHDARIRDRWIRAAEGWEAQADKLARDTLPVASRMVELIGPQPGHDVLDLAAGLGDTGFLAARADPARRR